MKSAHGFKSEIFTKKHGRLILQHEQQVTATTQSKIADELKASGKYKRVCCWSKRWHGFGVGGSPVAHEFFVLAFA